MILTATVFFLACMAIWRWTASRMEGVNSSVTVLAFVIKCVAGIAVWYMYAHVIDIDRRDADIFKYFDDGMVLHSSWEDSPTKFVNLFLGYESDGSNEYSDSMYNWEQSNSLIQLNDNRTVIRVHAIIAFLSQGDIIIHIIFFNLISFLGLLLLFKGFQRFTYLPGWMFILSCILPASLLFWGSGLLKEALVLFPLGLSVYGAASIYIGKGRWGCFIAGLVILSVLKPYVLLSFLPVIIYLIVRRMSSYSHALSFALSISLCIIVLFLSGLSNATDIIGVLSSKQRDFIDLAEIKQAGSVIDIPQIDDLFSLLLHSPGAIFRTYLRPGVWEIRSGMDGISAAENGLYILLILCAFIFRKKELNMDLLIMCLIFLICMGVLIGSVTPVLGAIVRYKVPALPFLTIAALHIIDVNKIKTLFR